MICELLLIHKFILLLLFLSTEEEEEAESMMFGDVSFPVGTYKIPSRDARVEGSIVRVWDQ